MGCYKAPKCDVRKTTTFLSVQIDFLFFKHETLNAITQQKNTQRCGIHARKPARSPRHSCRSAKRYNLQEISRRTPVYPEVRMRNGTSSPPMKCGILAGIARTPCMAQPCMASLQSLCCCILLLVCSKYTLYLTPFMWKRCIQTSASLGKGHPWCLQLHGIHKFTRWHVQGGWEV